MNLNFLNRLRDGGVLLWISIAVFILVVAWILWNKYQSSHDLEGDIVVRFQKGPCFGTCPVYDIKIDDKGNMIYEGKRHVRVLGKKYKHLGEDVVNDIYEGARSINFWDMAEKYDDDITDLPSTLLTLIDNNLSTNGEKTVIARANIPHHLVAYLEHIEGYWREFVE